MPLWMRFVIAKNSASPSITSQRASIPAPRDIGEQRLQHLRDAAALRGRVDVEDRPPGERRLRLVGDALEARPSARGPISDSRRATSSAWTSTSCRCDRRGRATGSLGGDGAEPRELGVDRLEHHVEVRAGSPGRRSRRSRSRPCRRRSRCRSSARRRAGRAGRRRAAGRRARRAARAGRGRW